MELEKEYYKWIEDNREKFAFQDCPSNVIAFLDSKGMFSDIKIKELHTILYEVSDQIFKTLCPGIIE